MLRVYIISPYTKGDIAVNVARSLKAANILINHGCAPYAPLLSHFQHMMFPQPYEKWLEIDMEWLLQCHAAIRLPGESSGGDREEKKAKENDIPVATVHEDNLDKAIGLLLYKWKTLWSME